MKKRNKHFFKEKTLIRLKLESHDIYKAIGNQSWVELDEPIHNGYYAEFILREDIQRRDDVAIFQEVLSVCNNKVWSRNPEFKYKNHKTKKWDVLKPSLNKIRKDVYESLSIQAKKFFVESPRTTKYWKYGYSDKEYRCTLTYELVIKITKAYITHRREHDNILYQMDVENEKMMYNIAGDNNPYGYNSYKNKFWRKHENKKEKLQAERKVTEVIKSYGGITSKKDLLDL